MLEPYVAAAETWARSQGAASIEALLGESIDLGAFKY